MTFWKSPASLARRTLESEIFAPRQVAVTNGLRAVICGDEEIGVEGDHAPRPP
jgi:hypothetical protein